MDDYFKKTEETAAGGVNDIQERSTNYFLIYQDGEATKATSSLCCVCCVCVCARACCLANAQTHCAPQIA